MTAAETRRGCAGVRRHAAGSLSDGGTPLVRVSVWGGTLRCFHCRGVEMKVCKDAAADEVLVKCHITAAS